MTSSRSQEWAEVRRLEDLLALVQMVDERRKVIRVQAWHEGNWTAVYQEATAMKKELEELKAAVSARWAELYEAVQK